MSGEVLITEDAIEAAARGLADHYTDVSFAAGEREVYSEHDTRDDARAAVEAAAPLILAAELERLANALHTSQDIGGAIRSMRARAFVLRGEGQTDA